MAINYMLYVDEKATTVSKTLGEAQEAAEPHIANAARLKIESYAAPAPSQEWLYDYEIADWVEQV